MSVCPAAREKGPNQALAAATKVAEGGEKRQGEDGGGGAAAGGLPVPGKRVQRFCGNM